MPIGTTNIKLSDIQTEYGGSNPISLSEYYRGGSFVLAHPNNTGIPASGAISVSEFFNQRKEWVVAVTIAADVSDFNLRNFLNSTYGDFSSVPTIATVTINSGINVYSTTTATPAFATGSFASGSSITIVNNGNIIGKGGNGGNGGNGSAANAGDAGSSGGNALNLSFNVTINNGSGNIFGGGGGGGGGGTHFYDVGNYAGGGGGGGGQGAPSSTGGTAGNSTTTAATNGGSGGASAGTGGAGGTFQVFSGEELLDSGAGGGGGNGGTYGAAGSAGANSASSNGGAGGAAGKAINLNGNVVTFTAGNNATQVKGAQS